MVSQYIVWYLDDRNLSDDYRTVLEDLKGIIAGADEYGLSLEKTKCYLIFLGNCTESSKKRIKVPFDEICTGIKVDDRENLEILGSPMGASARRDLLNKKMIELQRLSEVVTKLDAHYGFYLLKNCFSLPKLLYFLRTSPCFEELVLLQQYDSIIRNSLSKICNVNFNESSYTQAILPVSKGGIGIASASQIALPAFLASATGAKCALSCILPEDYNDASFEKALNLWLTKANLPEAPSDFIQNHWTSPLSDTTFDQLITDLDVENVKRLNAYQDPFGSAWLNVVPSKNLGLKLTDQQLRISLSLRLMIELQKLSEVVTNLDAHYSFYLLKNCFSLPKLLYFLRTSPCFEEVDLLQQYDSIIRKSLPNICNVNFDESSYTQAILPVSKGGIGVASASQIALPAFLASATGAKRALSCILSEDYVDASFEKALDLWLTKANLSEAPSDFIQNHWTSPLSDTTFDQLITDLDVKNVKRLNAYQDPFGSAWLNVVPSKNLGQKLTDQQLRISLSLRLGSKICEKHTCRIENGSVANPGTAAEDAEEMKTAKYVCLTDKGYISQPLAFEIQGGVGPSTSFFLKNLCKKLCVCNQETRTGSFFRQRLSRNPGRQCGQCSWNGSGRRPFKRTLLLVNPRFNVRFVSLRNICLLCFVIVTISHASLSF